jgi:hypothetical protein
MTAPFVRGLCIAAALLAFAPLALAQPKAAARVESPTPSIAADAKEAEGLYRRGMDAYLGRTKETDQATLQFFLRSAAKGNALAEAFAGMLIWHGHLARKDEKEGLRRIERAAPTLRAMAANGDADAQAFLGACYDQGLGVKQNVTEAIRLYREAVGKGNVFAMAWLGVSYCEGSGVAKDEKQGVEWFSQASAKGIPAQCRTSAARTSPASGWPGTRNRASSGTSERRTGASPWRNTTSGSATPRGLSSRETIARRSNGIEKPPTRGTSRRRRLWV